MDDASLNYIPFGAQQRIFSSGGLLGAAKGGLSRLASSLAGAGNTYQQGYDQQMSLESKLAQALAAARASDAQAQLHGVQAAEGQRKLDLGSPQGLREAALLGGGIPLDQADAFDQFTRTGTAPPGANWSPVAQRLAASQLVLGGGAKSQEDYFKGQGDQQQNAITGALVNGGLQGPQRDVALALMKAAPMFHAGPDGMVMSQYSGTVDTSNPLAQSNIGLKGAETGKNRAQAAQAYAAAGEHTAGAALKKAELGQGGVMGKAPPGYTWGQPDPVTGEVTQKMIPGGPADIKNQVQSAQDTAALNGTIAGFQRLATAANEVLKHPGLPGITGKMGMLPNIPGGEAANAKALLDTLTSQVGFSVLQDMRNNSKTGGALGAISDKEEQLLQNNLAALARSQSEDQYKTNLGKIIDYANAAQDRMRDAYNMKHGPGGPLPSPNPPAPTPPAPPAPGGGGRTVVRTGTLNGRKVIQYSDGSVDYSN